MKKIVAIVIATLLMSFQTSAKVSGILRTIVQIRDAAPENFASLLDLEHTKMLALGGANNTLYTQADADKLDVDAYAHFFAVAGLDFSQAVLDSSTGFLVILDSQGPLAAVAPFFIGGDGLYNVLYDSKDKRKNDGNWTIRNSSLIVQFLRSGTIVSGTAAGQNFAKGDLLSYGYTDHLRTDKNWTNSDFREKFIVSTPRLGNQPINGLGQTEIHASLQYVSANGQNGFGSDNVYKDMINTTLRQTTQNLVTFFEIDNTVQPS